MRPSSRIGPYEVVRELGRGGMGTVLEVRHPELPRRLALKLIASELSDAEALERFAREARLLARVRHPNVVTIHAFDRTADGRPYLVTDLVEGTSLRHVARAGGCDPLRAARILVGLASAVEALHVEGIVHRDLKPDNVILQADDTPVLLDFGLARDHDVQRLTQTGAVVGTPAYMAPEQAEGGGSASRVDARTDVYGLGAVLFELLAGRPPFEGGTIQVLAAVFQKEPRWPTDGVPPALRDVLRRAMAKTPAERHATAAALGEDLARFVAGEAVSAPARTRRRWVLVGVPALTLTLLGAALLRRGPAETRGPVAPHGEAAAPTASSVDARRSTPSWDEEAPVASYRAHLRWLAENETHPDVATVAGVATKRRLVEKPLRSVPVTAAAASDVTVRFLSNRELALLAEPAAGSAPTVHVLDLDGDQPPAPRWVLPLEAGRPLNLAVSPSNDERGQRTVLISGVRAVYGGREPDPTGAMRPIVQLAGRSQPSHLTQGHLDALAISPDGRLAVAAGDWPFAVLIDLTGDQPRELSRFGEFAHGPERAVFSPDGERIVLATEGTQRNRIEVLTKEGRPCASHQVGMTMKSLCFDPAGRLVVGTGAGTPLVQSSSTLDALELASLGVDIEGAADFRAAAPWLVFGAAPARILYGLSGPVGGGPSLLRVWRLGEASAAPEDVRRVRLQVRRVTSLDLSPDGSILAIGGELDGRRSGVELWAAGDR